RALPVAQDRSHADLLGHRCGLAGGVRNHDLRLRPRLGVLAPRQRGGTRRHAGHGRMNGRARALLRLRRPRGLQQAHPAELFGVPQATLWGWERGKLRMPEPTTRELARRLGAPLDSSADAGLRRLVESSTLPVLLVCDLTHRLLAASPAHYAAWRASPTELRG